MALIIFLMIRAPYLRTTSNYLLINLSCGGMFLALIVLPTQMIVRIDGLHLWKGFCKLGHVCFILHVIIMALTMFAIAWERTFAIFYPFVYSAKMNKQKMAWICCGLWILPVLFSLYPLTKIAVSNSCDADRLLTSPYLVIFVVIILITGVVVGCMYIKILSKVRQQLRKINILQVSCQSVDQHQGRCKDHKTLTLRKESKTTIFLAIITGSYFLCILPVIFVFISLTLGNEIRAQTVLYSTYATYLSNILNPVLYGFAYNDFRVALKCLFSCKDIKKLPDTQRG